MRHVFTYGTLMFEAVWRRVVGGDYVRVPARLCGYRRLCVAAQTYPALVAASAPTDAALPHLAGVLYLNVSAADLVALDAFEGDEYRRISVIVRIEVQPPTRAQTYPPTRAQTYLFVHGDRVDPRPWDPAGFEKQSLSRFLAQQFPDAQAVRKPRR